MLIDPHRALFMVSPYALDPRRRHRCEGVFVQAFGGDAQHYNLNDEKERNAFRAMVQTPHRVFVFWRAKPALLRLLDNDADVHRPLCLYTVERLLSKKPQIEQDVARSKKSAEDRLTGMETRFLDAVEALKKHPHRAVARLECLVIRAFAALEHRGLHIDEHRWRLLVSEAKVTAKESKQTFFDAMGDAIPKDLFGEPDLNLEQDEQVKRVLDQHLQKRGLQPLPNVTKYTLRKVQDSACNALVDFREANKIVSTYGDAFLAQIDQRTKRLHARFVPLGASTGRVASREPNLQNLPSSDAFHQCVRAPEGRVMVTADYATCELRILAQLSGDPVFAEAFNQGEDLHSRVATELFHKPVSKSENADLRARAKAINFGLVYGMGAAALAGAVGVSENEAQKLLAEYFQAFPKIKGYLEGSVDEALKQGFARTLLGRRLTFDPEILQGENPRGELSRIAKNMPIQGSSADMTKLAMVRVHETLTQDFNEAFLVNTVHDELVVECDAADGDAVAEVIRSEMSQAHSTIVRHVPPLVDVHVAPYWSH